MIFQGNRLGMTASEESLNDTVIDTLPDLKHLLGETEVGRIAKTSGTMWIKIVVFL